MPNRASLFSPFDALTGLKELLKECEEIKESPPILSPDQIEEINNQLKTIQEKDRISIIFFHKKKETIKGEIKKINKMEKTIRIENKVIKINEILEIAKEKDM